MPETRNTVESPSGPNDSARSPDWMGARIPTGGVPEALPAGGPGQPLVLPAPDVPLAKDADREARKKAGMARDNGCRVQMEWRKTGGGQWCPWGFSPERLLAGA